MDKLENNFKLEDIDVFDKIIKDNECKLSKEMSDRYSKISGKLNQNKINKKIKLYRTCY